MNQWTTIINTQKWFSDSMNPYEYKGGEKMAEKAENLRRITISITPSMEVELRQMKKERYCKDTQNNMIRDLIIRGLASLQCETEESGAAPKQSI